VRKLNEHDKTEWFDIAKTLRPGLTESEYDAMWARFQQAKCDHERSKKLN
jgi:hypothetical protein